MARVKKKRTGHWLKALVSIIIGVAILGIFAYVMHGHPIPVLQTAGTIADQERNLIIITTLLGVIVVVPVFIMLFTIAWRYRATNVKAKYQPEYTNRWVEAIWWGIPCFIILILGIITGIATHQLDPYKPIDSKVQPLNVEVVALQWRWLFIYPDQGTATIGYLNIPEKTPINLEITSDAPMNSFWIPALAGQIYAMSGMSTQLHLMADHTGSYNGSSANISGDGFSDMTFKVNSLSSSDFASWTRKAAASSTMLTFDSFKTIAKPTTDQKQLTYMLMDNDLYNEIIALYMPVDTTTSSKSDTSTKTEDSTDMNMQNMPGMNM